MVNVVVEQASLRGEARTPEANNNDEGEEVMRIQVIEWIGVSLWQDRISSCQGTDPE